MRKQPPPLPGPRETRLSLKSEHELLIFIIQQQPPFIENVLCTSNEAKSFKFMSTLNPHNNAMRCVPQFVTGNQEENQCDSKTSAPSHKVVQTQTQKRSEPLWSFYNEHSHPLCMGTARTSGVQASTHDAEPKERL